MTATYTSAPDTSQRDRIRFTLGDTDTADALLSDEEIAAALALKGDESAALVWLAKGLIRRYARQPVRVTGDGVTLDFSERVGAWRDLVSDLAAAETSGLRIRRLARPQLINGGSEYS